MFGLLGTCDFAHKVISTDPPFITDINGKEHELVCCVNCGCAVWKEIKEESK